MTGNSSRMPQRSVVLPKLIDKLMVKYAAETGQSMSSAIAQCVEIGLFQKLGDINKAAVFLSMENKRQEQKVGLEEDGVD